MPYATVVFDPNKISQAVIDKLKLMLQTEVAFVLSSDDVRLDPASTEDISTPPEQIMVLQHATHPTDVNVPPFELYIEAGRPKGRSEEKIIKLLGLAIAALNLFPPEYLGDGQAGIFLTVP